MTSLTAHYTRSICEEIIRSNSNDLKNITKHIEYIRMNECSSLFFYEKQINNHLNIS